MVNLSLAVQHHPSRPELRTSIARQLGTLVGQTHVEIVDDPEPMGAPSPWRCARVAWQTTPPWCTHRLVVQDDAILCANFWQRTVALIERYPTDVLSLFFGQNSYHLGVAAYRDAHELYPLPLVGWVPCVALLMPRDLALDLGAFELPHHARASVADDEVVCEWAHSRGLTAYATRPSLVDHDDSQPSLMGTDPTRVRAAVEFVC